MRNKSWDDLAAEQDAAWYLDHVVAQQKRDMNLELFRKWTEGVHPTTILKTDLFEEASGRADVLANLSESACLIGMDISHRMVSRAKTRNPASNAMFLVSDACDLALASGTVDVIFSNSTLDHFLSVKDFETSLLELGRVLKPGGIIIITLDNLNNPLYHILKWLGTHGFAPFKMGYTTTLNGLVMALQKIGMEVTATDYQIHNPRLISTALFLSTRRILGRFADQPIRFFLRCFALLNRLPTRGYTACFIAARGRKL
jgi:ubiquinone/menaquinone biosynthesis C-methylase UbiE